GQEQTEISTRFARSGADKWGDAPVLFGETGMPAVPDSLAVFECETSARHDGGDHTIFVGRVLTIATAGIADPRPLVFFKGRYRQLDRSAAPPTPDGADAWLHGWG